MAQASRGSSYHFALLATALALAISGCGGGGGAAGTPGPSRDLATVALSPRIAARTSEAGAFAADYLRGKNFSSLVVEVGYPAGREPSQAVLDLLADRLAERCNKPGGVSV